MIDQITMLEIWREHAATLEAATLEKQRDELLAALKELVESLAMFDEEGLIEHAEPMMRARAAIAKVEATK